MKSKDNLLSDLLLVALALAANFFTVLAMVHLFLARWSMAAACGFAAILSGVVLILSVNRALRATDDTEPARDTN